MQGCASTSVPAKCWKYGGSVAGGRDVVPGWGDFIGLSRRLSAQGIEAALGSRHRGGSRAHGIEAAHGSRHRGGSRLTAFGSGPKTLEGCFKFARACLQGVQEPRAKSQEPRAKSQEPRAKSQEPRAKSQEPRAKSQEPRAESRKPKAESRKPARVRRRFTWPARLAAASA